MSSNAINIVKIYPPSMFVFTFDHSPLNKDELVVVDRYWVVV